MARHDDANLWPLLKWLILATAIGMVIIWVVSQ